MRKTFQSSHANLFLAVLLASTATTALGVDYESFEFNDPNYSELMDTANTANPFNQWSQDIDYMVDSYIYNGSYEIHKASTYYAQNYLQIDDITSGTRYMVVEMSGWDIRPTDVVTDPEQVRFGFITEDTGTDGNTIVAEMQITSREVESTPVVQIEGYALGDGSTGLPSAVTINTVQSDPFVMVLELNKTDNSYEVYYKDGSKPSQSLGSGQLAPDRDGNSIRFFVNNNFGEDELGAAPDEFFAINRFALTDTNPLSDLLTVEVDRNSGEVKLINNTGTALTGLESYSLTSAIGALDSSGWKPITDNYDNAAGPGNGSVDPDDDWGIDSSGTSELTESVLAGDGGGLAIGQEVILSTGDGPWIKNPTEDIVAEFLFTGGETRRASVHFVGNGGTPFEVGDLNFDGSITAADWPLFMAGSEADLSALSLAQAYQMGDLNYGGVNSFADLELFKEVYEAANGAGSFEAMLAGVPEPGSLLLLAMGLGLTASRRRNR